MQTLHVHVCGISRHNEMLNTDINSDVVVNDVLWERLHGCVINLTMVYTSYLCAFIVYGWGGLKDGVGGSHFKGDTIGIITWCMRQRLLATIRVLVL